MKSEVSSNGEELDVLISICKRNGFSRQSFLRCGRFSAPQSTSCSIGFNCCKALCPVGFLWQDWLSFRPPALDDGRVSLFRFFGIVLRDSGFGFLMVFSILAIDLPARSEIDVGIPWLQVLLFQCFASPFQKGMRFFRARIAFWISGLA